MNTLSRTITGILSVTLGVILSIIALQKELWLLWYGVPIIIIGIIIFFNTKEDKIEQIKSKKANQRGK